MERLGTMTDKGRVDQATSSLVRRWGKRIPRVRYPLCRAPGTHPYQRLRLSPIPPRSHPLRTGRVAMVQASASAPVVWTGRSSRASVPL